MTPKKRAALFLTCLFLFLLIAPSAIFYSQGYRIDFNPPAGGLKIVQTGGIFLKVEPKQATVFVDEKLKKKTDFLFGTILIKNLLPGWHKIRVEKNGFHSWEKNLEIKEKEVTEAKNIILIPQNPKFTVLTQGIKNFSDFPELKEIFPTSTNATTSNSPYYLDESGYLFKNGEKLSEMSFKTLKISPNFQKLALIRDYEIRLLFIEPQSSQPQRKANEQIYLTRFSKKIGEVFWYNPDYLLFNVGGEIKITEIDNRDQLNIADLISFKESETENLKIFFDQNNKKLYILNKGDFSVSEKLLP